MWRAIQNTVCGAAVWFSVAWLRLCLASFNLSSPEVIGSVVLRTEGRQTTFGGSKRQGISSLILQPLLRLSSTFVYACVCVCVCMREHVCLHLCVSVRTCTCVSLCVCVCNRPCGSAYDHFFFLLLMNWPGEVGATPEIMKNTTRWGPSVEWRFDASLPFHLCLAKEVSSKSLVNESF